MASHEQRASIAFSARADQLTQVIARLLSQALDYQKDGRWSEADEQLAGAYAAANSMMDKVESLGKLNRIAQAKNDEGWK